MYQFHGWFGLSDSTEDSDEQVLDAAVDELRRLMDDLAEYLTVRQVTPLNGDYFLLVAGAGNRPRDTPVQLDRLLSRVAELLPGSYGLLYERDDEAVESNAFRVRKLARGVVSEESDPFLSPIVPTIED